MPVDENPRAQILSAPTSFLDLERENIKVLGEMGFDTVSQAFRAALVGRLCTRRKGGRSLQDKVLASCCRLLGHPILCREDITHFSPLPGERTLADGLERINGGPIKPSKEQLNHSLRSLLLPGTLHRGISKAGLKTIGELLYLPLDQARQIVGIGEKNIGQLLIHLFDFFLLECPGITNGRNGFSNGNPPAAPAGRGVAHQLSELAGDDLPHPETIIIHRYLIGGIFAGEENKTAAIALLPGRGNPPMIKQVFCDICGKRPRDDAPCPHAEGLAARVMITGKNGHSLPIGEVIEKGIFGLIIQILFEVFGQGEDGSLEAVKDREGSWRLNMPGPDGRTWASWLFAEKDAALCLDLFPQKFRKGPRPKEKGPAGAATLYKRLLEGGRSISEISINDIGRLTNVQQRDESIWNFLVARALPFAVQGEAYISLPDDHGLCRLCIDREGEEIFSLTLPRARTGDMLGALDREGFRGNILPPATLFNRLSRNEDSNDVRLSLILRLADGEEFDCRDLEEARYGNFYYIAGHGFVAIPGTSTTENTERHEAAEIPLDSIPEFIRSHPGMINDPANDIADEFRDIEIKNAPDSLEFDELNYDEGWCYISGNYGLGKSRLPIVELLESRRAKKRYRNSDNKWLDLEASPLDWLFNLGPERIWQDNEGKDRGIRLSLPELLLLKAQMPETTAGGGNINLDRLLENTSSQINVREPDLPAHLREYQKHGVSWMANLCSHGLGSILADDMGLGKTHQALAMMTAILSRPSSACFLVICPATVVPHWLEKIEKFFPDITPFVYHGSRRSLKKCGKANLFLTTYGIIRRDAELLAQRQFDLIFFDEIQQLKNKNTEAYRAAVKLKGKIVIGLTGTPLENSVHDLKAIFDLCLPGYLKDDRWFNNHFAQPVAEGDSKAQEELGRMIAPFVLRRSREQVLTELPEVIEDERTCRLSDEQVGIYRDIINNRGRPLLERIRRNDTQGGLPYMELLAVINYLKQVCDHPCLLQSCDDPEQFKSGKWDLFRELLEECLDARMKVVIFSHYTRMLDLIEGHLVKNDIDFCGLRGEMNLKTRQEMIKRFNNDPGCRVFSASLLAGGVGVDLTAAQAVIHYDRWWNAAREDQATARVHRMGQKKVVQVFKLVTVGTLEEKINRLIAKKRELARTLVQDDDAGVIKRLDREEIISLLSPNV